MWVNRRYLERRLNANGWNVTRTAAEIGLGRTYLNQLIREYGLVRPPRKH